MQDRRTFLTNSARLLGGTTVLAAVPLLATGGNATALGPMPRGGTTAAGSLTTVRTLFNWVPDIEWAAWYLAESKGFFAERGVESDLVHGGPNTPAVVQMLAAGDGDVGISAGELDILLANATGTEYVALGAMYQRSPSGYAWLAETDIQSAEDLVGLRIGGPQGDQFRIDAVFELNGLPADYEFVPMSFDPQPLVDGEVDVITAYVTNQPVQLELRGVETRSAPYSDFGLKQYGDVIFADRSYIDANRDLLVGYFAALLAGVEANLADPEEAIPLLVDTYGADQEIDEDYARAGNPAYISLMDSEYTDANGLLSIDPDFLENEVWPGYEAAGQTDLPDVSSFLDTTLLADAHALLGSDAPSVTTEPATTTG
jgi:ABC-type nitrate/sulfonate/bicarbonate transport system substrate-binding protein